MVVAMGAIIARGGDFPRDLRFLRDWVLETWPETGFAGWSAILEASRNSEG